jgi:hypothetical protein
MILIRVILCGESDARIPILKNAFLILIQEGVMCNEAKMN